MAATALHALLVPVTPAAEIAAGERRSGYEFMSAETRAMQDDDVTNPAVLSLLDGEELWKQIGRAHV